MSNDVPIQLIVAAYQDEKAADEALDELKAAKWAGLIGIKDAAVIRKDQKGKLHIKETGDMGGGKGAVIGGVVGADGFDATYQLGLLSKGRHILPWFGWPPTDRWLKQTWKPS